MGRLSDYINGNQSSGSNRNGDVEVSGFVENSEMLGHLLTTDPTLAQNLKTIIRKALKQARANISKDAAGYLQDDPRKAARAVKYAVYKSLFGGNVSILNKGRGKAGVKYELRRARKLDASPNQRGGNRRPRVNDGRNRLDYYFGADRGFILRFISSGTISRDTRFGNRGSIRARGWFGHVAPWQMESAATEVADAINEFIKHEING